MRLDRRSLDTSLLSADELARANAFTAPPLRRRFVAAHAGLRLLLARYTATPPADLVFGRDAYGKPYLEQAPGLSFNLSHSGCFAACAVASNAPVGIDCEELAPLLHLEGVARAALSPEEVDALGRLSARRRLPAFYRIWTRKEALSKATGLGLRLPFREFSAWRRKAQRSAVVAGVAFGRWRLTDLPAPRGFAAALCTPVDVGHVSQCGWLGTPDADREVAGEGGQCNAVARRRAPA